MTIDQALESARSRIVKNSKPEGDCIIWQGTTNPNGYGYMSMPNVWRRRIEPVHRVVCHLHHGPAPEGAQTCHSCDVRACVNPDHVRWCTVTENMSDRYSRRQQGTWGELHPQAKYTDAQVTMALALFDDGLTRKIIAEELSINYWTLCRIIQGRNRKRQQVHVNQQRQAT